jgi:hypothetical protein
VVDGCAYLSYRKRLSKPTLNLFSNLTGLHGYASAIREDKDLIDMIKMLGKIQDGN